MIFIMFSRSIVYNLPWFIIPLKPVIIDARGFSGLRPGIQKVLEFGDSCDGRVDGSALGWPANCPASDRGGKGGGPSEIMILGAGDRPVVVGTTLSSRNSTVQFAAPLISIPEKKGCMFAIYRYRNPRRRRTTQSTAAAKLEVHIDPRSLDSVTPFI